MSGIASISYDSPLVPEGGLFTIKNASKMLSEFGRNGDTYVVHAKEGETVIPMEVLDNNPRLKKMLFQQMRELDLDPARYIVGNELNSINPVTGQPEFFLKKLFKGLKKIVKKVAPIVLPIAAPFLLPTMPMFLATGLGSLAGGLVAGQRPQDALKNAVIAGGLAGLGNMAFGQGGFGASGIEAGITKGQYDVRNLFSGGESSNITTTLPTKANIGTTTQTSLPKGTVGSLQPRDSSLLQVGGDPTLGIDELRASVTAPKETGILDSIKELGGKAKGIYDDYISPSRQSIQPTTDEIIKSAQATAKGELDLAKKLGIDLTKDRKADILMKAVKTAKADLAPSALEKFAPLTGIAGLTLYGLDKSGLPIFTVPDQETGQETFITGKDLLEMYPEDFRLRNFYGQNPYYLNRADGGEIVGPGTSTSDSIPAMLSDGEFVMNARAVQGAGGGDRKEGAKRMYAMMKRFEKVA
tara:strand:- start:1046 stop:2452 length:1407 start_codon:yes stop_codon:yes gene_type:complete